MTIFENIRKALQEVAHNWDVDKLTPPPEKMKFPNWYGFGTSGDNDDVILTLFIAHATPPEEATALNRMIAEIPDAQFFKTVEMTRTDRFKMSAGKLAPALTQLRPGAAVNATSPNCSTSTADPCDGTIGAFVRLAKTTEPVWLLTCSHVLLNDPGCAKDVKVEDSQGASISRGAVPFVPLSPQPNVNLVDAALAKLADPTSANPTYSPIKIIKTTPVRPPTGTIVQKLGATSTLTSGTILKYCGRMEVIDCAEKHRFNFEDLVMIQSDGKDDFAEDGDSGSLVISADGRIKPEENKRPVGLLFAISDSENPVPGSATALACPWDNVISAIGKLISPIEMMLIPTP